jgi:hypothetical protein
MTCVIGVAIKTKHGLVCSLLRPNRHPDVINKMVSGGFNTPVKGEQGFLLNNGMFADRTHAKQIAKNAGQLLSRAHKGAHLFSECVW